MLRIFRATDTTKHCGLRTQVACVIFGILVTCMEIFCFVLLPSVPRWILIPLASLMLLLLIAGCATLRAPIIITFMIFNMLLKIPIFVVIYFTTYTLVSYDYPNEPPHGNCYQCWLYRQSVGFLWAGLIMSFACVISDGFLTTGLRKLRLLGRGVTTVVVGRQHCHRQHPVVIEAPRQVIYTTPASTGVVYTTTPVYQTPAYPAAQPSVYLQAQYPTAQATAPAVTTPQAPPEYKP
nr:unnamed protein product [Haemonchus contortus]